MFSNNNKKILNIQIISKEINKTNLTIKDFDYDIEKPIGKGGFCVVYKAIFKQTKKVYALKIINKSMLNKEEDLKNINNEVKIMNEISHPNLLKLVTYFEDENNIYIILPLCQNGQLFDLVHRPKKRIPSIIFKKYLYQTIQAIKYLHSKKIVHRDIKPENILIDNNDNALLSDYGIAAEIKNGEKRHTFCGTDDYLAPEVIRGQGYDEKIDIWAIGILIYECFSPSGKTPFNKLDFLQRSNDNKDFLIKSDKDLKIKYDKDFEPLARNLIERIIKINPDERLNIDDILKHFFFNDVDLKKKNDLFVNLKKDNELGNEIKLLKDNVSKETYDKMLNSFTQENNKIKKELQAKKEELLKIKNEKESLNNKIEILNQTLNDCKMNLDEKTKEVERLTEKKINQLGEGQTTLPVNSVSPTQSKNIKFTGLIITSNENYSFKSINDNSFNKYKYYEIGDIDNFYLTGKKSKNGEKGNNELNINTFVSELKSAKKFFDVTIVKMDDNLNDMKSYLKKNDNEFKDKFLSKFKEFNNIISDLKNKTINSINSTMEKIMKDMDEKKIKSDNLYKEKIQKDEVIIKEHELGCKSKIENLTRDIQMWKSKAESNASQILVKEKLIKTLKEEIQKKNDDYSKQNELLQNYQKTFKK